MFTRFISTLVLLAGFGTTLHASDFSATFAKVSATTVVIHTRASMEQLSPEGTQTRSSEGLGSGVVISEDGKILTAAHVVSVADDILVQFKSGNSYPAHVVSMAACADIALLRLNEQPFTLESAILGDAGSLETGEEVFVIGAPEF